MRARHLDRSLLLWLLLAGVLLALVVNPLVRLLWVSVHGSAGLTLDNYVTAYSRWRYVEALGNSLVLGVSVGLLCIVFGVPMAWAVSRTDMPGKTLVWAAVLGTFIVPSYLSAVAWILLAGPNAGWLNRAWIALTGAAAGPFNIYSMPGLVLVIAASSFPYMFVFTRSALDLISSEMEDAATTLGAGVVRTTLRVTLPLTLPAILAAFIVEFLEAIALFGAPALIALPGRFQVMTTTLWQFFEFPPRVEVAAAYAMPLLAITVLLFWLQQRIIARKGYVALTGMGGERRLVRLGRWRWAMLGYCLLVTALGFFLPMVVVVQAAFAKAWGRGFSADNLTLQNLRFVLIDQPLTRAATVHTFVYGFVSAALALALALGIAYIVRRKLVPFGHALAYVAMAP
ncbi:MAG TPA: ABC transporter permease subunit, partial [Methylomirabilota bacterium]|nr:ABC transporter permease subunit [Methylomirabilota bacterium]